MSRRRRGAMVPTRKTEAYVLRSTALGEDDRVVVVLSAELGRLEGVARRARRVRGGPGAAWELLSRIRVEYRERPGRDLVSFGRVELITSAFGLVTSPEAHEALAHLAELAAAVAVPGQASGDLFRLLTALLEALAAAGEDRSRRDLLRLYFDIWVARLEGYWPELGACAGCGRELVGDRRVSAMDEGVRCGRCAPAAQGVLFGLGEEAAALAAAMARQGPREVGGDASARATGELARLVAALLTVHLDRRLRTLPPPDALRRAPGGRG